MKAVVAQRYGSPAEVLEIRDVDVPAIGDDDVLVRTRATAANPANWHLIRGEPQIARLQIGLRRPKHPVLGCDVAGTSRPWAPTSPGSCRAARCSATHPECGAFAEYVRVPAACFKVRSSDGVNVGRGRHRAGDCREGLDSRIGKY